MTCSRDGFCNVVYAMHRFLKICVLVCVYFRFIVPGFGLRFIVKFYYSAKV